MAGCRFQAGAGGGDGLVLFFYAWAFLPCGLLTPRPVVLLVLVPH